MALAEPQPLSLRLVERVVDRGDLLVKRAQLIERLSWGDAVERHGAVAQWAAVRGEPLAHVGYGRVGCGPADGAGPAGQSERHCGVALGVVLSGESLSEQVLVAVAQRPRPRRSVGCVDLGVSHFPLIAGELLRRSLDCLCEFAVLLGDLLGWGRHRRLCLLQLSDAAAEVTDVPLDVADA